MKVDHFFAFRNRGDESKPFLSHLEDLRFTIVKIAIALILAMVACFLFRNELAAIVQRPLIAVDPQRAAIPGTTPPDGLPTFLGDGSILPPGRKDGP